MKLSTITRIIYPLFRMYFMFWTQHCHCRRPNDWKKLTNGSYNSATYKGIKRGIKETMADPLAVVDVMRWVPGVRRADDNDMNKQKKKKTVHYCRKEAYKQARSALENMASRSSSYLVSGISRIRPTHDALHRDKFTYHGGVHTAQDDLIAMAFIDTLQSLQMSLSPPHRGSPTGSTDHQPINTDELFEKVNTLRSCVAQMPIFQIALSDKSVLNPIGPHHPLPIHSQSFDDHLVHKEGGHCTVPNPKASKKEVSEHGSLLGIVHHKSLMNVKGNTNPP
eukprot:612516_1